MYAGLFTSISLFTFCTIFAFYSIDAFFRECKNWRFFSSFIDFNLIFWVFPSFSIFSFDFDFDFFYFSSSRRRVSQNFISQFALPFLHFLGIFVSFSLFHYFPLFAHSLSLLNWPDRSVNYLLLPALCRDLPNSLLFCHFLWSFSTRFSGWVIISKINSINSALSIHQSKDECKTKIFCANRLLTTKQNK